jgi:hypothetical protein
VAGRSDGFGMLVKQQPAGKGNDDKTEVEVCTFD